MDIALLHRIIIDNNTLSQIDFQKYGKSLHGWIRDIILQHNLNQTGLQIISGIIPNLGKSTPYYSASIPFVASGVALWSPSGAPFLAMYEVSAKIVQPEIVNKIENNLTK